MKRDGSLYAIGDTCYLKYYIIGTDGKRVHKTAELCKRSDVHDWWKKKGKWGFSSAVRELQREKMDKVKADAKAAAAAKAKASTPSDITVVTFWEERYLPYCEQVVPLTGQPRRKPETVRGFKQIWKQHLKGHFAGTPPAADDIEGISARDRQSLPPKLDRDAGQEHVEAHQGSR